VRVKHKKRNRKLTLLVHLSRCSRTRYFPVRLLYVA